MLSFNKSVKCTLDNNKKYIYVSGSPPQQVVRQPQLLVTDGGPGGPGGPNQLQLPQRPTPPGGLPNLPKPVPSQAAAHKPKIIPGKGM